jgi:hypothetical protein
VIPVVFGPSGDLRNLYIGSGYPVSPVLLISFRGALAIMIRVLSPAPNKAGAAFGMEAVFNHAQKAHRHEGECGKWRERAG